MHQAVAVVLQCDSNQKFFEEAEQINGSRRREIKKTVLVRYKARRIMTELNFKVRYPKYLR